MVAKKKAKRIVIVKRENTSPFKYRNQMYYLYERCPSRISAEYTVEHLPVGLKGIVAEFPRGYGVFVTKDTSISTKELMKEARRVMGKYPKRIIRER